MRLIVLFLSISFTNVFSQKIEEKTNTICKNGTDVPYLVKNRLLSKKLINDTLQIRIGLVKPCNFNAAFELTKENDTLILNSIQNNFDVFVCNCYFEVEIKISDINDTNDII
ncbi:MAG: hypothetical protein ACRCYO_08525, partial [Bacteroidia bacterium]